MILRIALLGAGRIGRVHARAIAHEPAAKLVAVADTLPDAARAIADRHGCVIREIDTVAAAGDIDAVVICTPTDTHADLIERFARAGKAIFCEKPVDLSVERMRNCLSVVAENRARLMIGFNRRFDPHFSALKQAIDAGRVGTVEQIIITSRDPGPPPAAYIRVSGGIFRDMTIHDFDMARFLLDEAVSSVFATASVLVDPKIGELGDADTASVVLRTASGRQVSILNSHRATYGHDQRIEVHGSKGIVQAGNLRPVNIEVADAGGYTRPPLHDFFMTRYAEAYAAELKAFIAAVNEGVAISPDGLDGLEASLLAEAALESTRTGALVNL